MIVTITNVHSDKVYISCLYTSLDVGQSVNWDVSQSQLDAESQLNQLVVDGYLTMSFAGGGSYPEIPDPTVTYSNTTRPAATSVAAGTMIFNTDDNAPNFSDGTNWRDADGVIT